MLNIIQQENSETTEHLTRVKALTELLINEHNKRKNLNLSQEYLTDIIQASELHDIGKVAIPKNILYKPGPLNDEERTIIETHPLTGAYILEKIIRKSKELEESIDYNITKNIILCHHERWDGTGYPYKIGKEEIPFEARIMAIVDVYDALTSERCYKKAWTIEEAIHYIIEKKEEFFDPEIVETFITLKEQLNHLQKIR